MRSHTIMGTAEIKSNEDMILAVTKANLHDTTLSHAI